MASCIAGCMWQAWGMAGLLLSGSRVWEAVVHLVAELVSYTEQQQCISAGQSAVSLGITQDGNSAGRLWVLSAQQPTARS